MLTQDEIGLPLAWSILGLMKVANNGKGSRVDTAIRRYSSRSVSADMSWDV